MRLCCVAQTMIASPAPFAGYLGRDRPKPSRNRRTPFASPSSDRERRSRGRSADPRRSWLRDLGCTSGSHSRRRSALDRPVSSSPRRIRARATDGALSRASPGKQPVTLAALAQLGGAARRLDPRLRRPPDRRQPAQHSCLPVARDARLEFDRLCLAAVCRAPSGAGRPPAARPVRAARPPSCDASCRPADA